jgi:hypothetical protein
MLLLMAPWKFQAWRFPDFHLTQNEMLDPVQQYYPWRHFAVESLESGRIPLWNPYCFSGTPFVANMQSAVFYPPNLLFLFLPITTAFTVSAVLHIFIAGASMFALLRSMGLSTAPCLLGAVAYMFNGSLVAWLEFPALGQWVMPWLPLAILCLRRCMSRPTAPNVAIASAVLAVQLLGGHLQYSAYVLLACGIFIGLACAKGLAGVASQAGEKLERAERRASSDTAAKSKLRPALLAAGTALCLGFALAACQLLPSIELAQRSARPQLSYQDALQSALPFSQLVNYFAPLLFGTPAQHNYWGHLAAARPVQPGMFMETACYIGLLPLLLALAGARCWRTREAAFFLAVSAVALLVALGTPLYALFYYLAPGFKQLAGVSRIVYLAAFGLAGLAALGLEELTQKRLAFVPLAAGLLMGALLVAADLFMFSDAFRATWPHTARQLTAAAVLLFAALVPIALVMRNRVFAWLALAVAAADLFYFGVPFNPATEPRMAYFSTPETSYLQRNIGSARILALGMNATRDWMPPNTPLVYRLRDIQGSDSLWWRRYAKLLKSAEPSAPSPQWRDLGSPLLDLLSVRYIITTQTLGHPDWALVFDAGAPVAQPYAGGERAQGARIYRHRSELPRACLVEIPPEEATRRNERRQFQKPWPAQRDHGARIVSDGIDSVRMEVRAPRPMFLRLADSAYPGWRAFVDGEPCELLVADHAFRMVQVPAGKHQVEFRYEPASFRLGVFVSLLALGCMVFAAAYRRR